MNEEISIDNIPVVEPTESKFDATAYEGFKTKIEKVVIKEVIDKYPDGNYTPDSQEMKKVVEVITSPLPELDENGNPTDKPITFLNEDGETKNIQVTKRFNLQVQEGKLVISKHPKAGLWKAMRKLGAIQLSDMEGKIVVLTTTPSKIPDDDRVFLDIVL